MIVEEILDHFYDCDNRHLATEEVLKLIDTIYLSE